jgi:hypothetical protein
MDRREVIERVNASEAYWPVNHAKDGPQDAARPPFRSADWSDFSEPVRAEAARADSENSENSGEKVLYVRGKE